MDGKPEPFVDRVLDELLPEELEWRRLVVRYPLAAVGVAAALGFVLGRWHGETVVAAASGFIASEVSDRVGSLLGDEAV